MNNLENILLKTLKDFVREMNETNSSSDKKEVLKKHEYIKDLLKLIYDPKIQFGITSKFYLKQEPKLALSFFTPSATDIVTFLSLLQEENSRTTLCEIVYKYIQENLVYRDLILKIIDKNLKCQIDTKSINSVFPNLIPSFDIALGYPVKDEGNFDFNTENWLASRKLDGVRLIVESKEDKISFYSKEGNRFTSLSKLIPFVQELKSLVKRDFILDGECCIIKENGEEDFTSVVGEIKRKNFTIENPKYCIFDFLTMEEFRSGSSDTILSDRITDFSNIYQSMINTQYTSLVDQIKIVNHDHLNSLKDLASGLNWEGLILRKDTTYKGKRSNDLLKIKEYNDLELLCLDIEYGPIPHLIKGKKQDIHTVSNLLFSYKGFPLSVGSGLNEELRSKIKAHPSIVIGKEVTIRYFRESKNQDGGLSLRWPRIKHIWGKKRDI
jgi:DNA ligase-1